MRFSFFLISALALGAAACGPARDIRAEQRADCEQRRGDYNAHVDPQQFDDDVCIIERAPAPDGAPSHEVVRYDIEPETE